MKRPLLIAALPLIALSSANAEDTIQQTIHERGEATLLAPATSLEQARTQMRSRSDFGLELRPSIDSNDELGLALRIYLPNKWDEKNLKQRLELAATAEQLRIAQLEWNDVTSVYRDLASYRMLQKKSVLLQQELEFIAPFLKLADQRVERNQLDVADRTRLYSDKLALLNDLAKEEAEQIKISQRIKMVLGPDAKLAPLAESTVISMPSRLELNQLLRTALQQRADYLRFNVDMETMQLAEDAAKKENRFCFKYLQPSYNVDYASGEQDWQISTAIELPWGKHNPEIALFQQHQALSLAAQDWQRQNIEDRLRILIETAEACKKQVALQNQRTAPVLAQLKADLEQKELPLEQVRNQLNTRKQILDAKLQNIELQQQLENLAIDFAEELGGNL